MCGTEPEETGVCLEFWGNFSNLQHGLMMWRGKVSTSGRDGREGENLVLRMSV